ncbi:hypothetical protein J5X84_02435 [Streptosporangiaceae bacterium NEAU-GS5]|nr:hypothetical protein [Streptosporangiaceae bacterium NEAU-GS5]
MRGGGIHGEFVVPKDGGGYQTVATQQGEVTAVASDSLTVKSEDGFSRTYTVGENTRVNAGREGVDAIKTGDQVSVMATVEGSTATAVMVIDMTRPDMGKGWFRHGREFHRNPSSPATPESVTPTA